MRDISRKLHNHREHREKNKKFRFFLCVLCSTLWPLWFLSYTSTYASAEELGEVIPLLTGTTKQLKVIIESSDRKPVMKLLEPDYDTICKMMIPDNYLSLICPTNIQPDVHSLKSDTPMILHSQKIPIVWKKAGDPFYYGRFFTKSTAQIKNWNIKVVDSSGKKIIKYKGVGSPPEDIDLKDEDKTKFHVGEPYFPILSLTAKNRKKYIFYGDVFSFDVLINKKVDGSTCIKINSSTFFNKYNLLTKKGKDIIYSIKSLMPEINNPSVEIKTQTSKKKIAEIRTYNLIEILMKEFLIPIKNISAGLYIYSELYYPSIELIIQESGTGKR